MLGLAQKAGRVASGETAAEYAVRSGEARLLIAAEDASAGSRKRLLDRAAYRKIPALVWGDKESLGRAVGKNERAGLVITEEGFARQIAELIRQDKNTEETEGV